MYTRYKYRWVSDFAKGHIAEGVSIGLAKGLAKGEARGMAKGIVACLEARGIDVPFATRERILSCADPDQLERLIRQAVFTEDAETLFR